MYKKCIIFMLSLVLTCAFCFYKRDSTQWKSFDESYKNKNHYYNMAVEILSNKYEGVYTVYHDIQNLNALEEKSDVIAIVQLKNRKQIYNNIESTVEIVKLFKGDINESLVIIEAGKLFDNRVFNDGFLPLLKEDELYIVFLQETNGINKYNYVDESFSMYLLKDNYNVKELAYESDQILSYDVIKNYDYYVINYDTAVCQGVYTQEQVDIYNQTVQEYFGYSLIIKDKYS